MSLRPHIGFRGVIFQARPAECRRARGAFTRLIGICLLEFCFAANGPAQSGDDVQVTLESNESLRSLAAKYLGGPNDWEIILLVNGLQSPDQLRTGQRLRIPVKQFHRTVASLDRCRSAIAAANAEGASILATQRITAAADLESRALGRKKRGELDEAQKDADEAARLARAALSETRAKRHQSVAAVLKEKRGTVQKRPPDVLRWDDAALLQDLIEKDRVRTLSRSYGNIQFVDGSSLRMDENALIVIESSKKDVVKNTSTADILVLEGDVSALIRSLSSENPLRVSSPGVQTGVRSRHYMAGRDRDWTARFSNFEGELDVSAAGRTVKLAVNEGTRVKSGAVPENPRKLPDPPVPLEPRPGRSLFTDSIDFSWRPVAGAESFRVEIAADPAFQSVVKTLAAAGAGVRWTDPENGAYFWRVRAGDRDRLQGPFSAPTAFTVRKDHTPPFLEWNAPASDTAVSGERLRIRGRTESGAVVTVGADTLMLSSGGAFDAEVRVEPGIGILRIVAVDSAGNRSVISRGVTVSSVPGLFILDTQPPDRTAAKNLTLAGRVKPGVRLWLNGRAVDVGENVFRLSPALREGENIFHFRAVSAEEGEQSRTVTVISDVTPPVLRMPELPEYTNRPEWRFEGDVSEPCVLRLNGRPVPFDSVRFGMLVRLMDGPNAFLLEAVDPAGNASERRVTVFLDTLPPVVVSTSFSAPRTHGGEKIEAVVRAADAGAGASRTASCVVEILPCGARIPVLLKRAPDSDEFRASLAVPSGCAGTPVLRDLMVSDYLGNARRIP
ncbi:FecR domain-containing protein [bacterium]|nr:FecR domain-containing protein [bacterium]